MSICGTDMHIYEWDAWSQKRIKMPLIQGHEWAGEVVELGSACTWAKQGDYVSGEGHIACGSCYQCRTGNAHVCQNVTILGIDRPGAFSEYMAVPEKNLIRNDSGLPLEYASIQNPLGNAVYTVFNGDVVAKDVAIFGLGPIGLMAVALCRHIGAKRIFAVGHKNEYRIRLPQKARADPGIQTSHGDPPPPPHRREAHLRGRPQERVPDPAREEARRGPGHQIVRGRPRRDDPRRHG